MSGTTDTSQAEIGDIEPLQAEDAEDYISDIKEQITAAVVAEDRFIDLLLTGVIARGHIQLEDVPGTGKTVASRVLAEALGVDFSRVQFTPDLLPADVTGSHVYNEKDQEFEFQKGPVFANVVLADEINRAPPKTQAALLEAMGEQQVSMNGTTYELPKPFFVIATQNPVEQQGTFELPEAQRDRFLISTKLGYPDRDGAHELLERRANRFTQEPSVTAVCDPRTVRQLQVTAETVEVEMGVRDYILDIVEKTRDQSEIEIGVSPRGVQMMFEAARAWAVVNGRNYVVPEDVKQLADPVFSHRLVLTTEAATRNVNRSDLLADILDSTEVPGMAD